MAPTTGKRRTKRAPKDQLRLGALAVESKTAPCVPSIEREVQVWRAQNYPGTTETTRELLQYWFFSDHKLRDGRRFQYYDFQREAIETLIYLWEVKQVRDRIGLLERYAQVDPQATDLRLPQYDAFARYAIKMATGSGKTKVMSLAIAWQYLNAAREGDPDYAKTFLVIAPNVIVFERLRSDFAGGRIFNEDPLIPKHMKIFWELDCVMRGEGERAPADGMLFLTNIQQLYEPKERPATEPDAMTGVLGPKPSGEISEARPLADRIAERPGTLLVVNDEAHHTHDETSEWSQVIRRLHEQRPIAAQLDFSATPRFTKGQLFPWTIYDYPLKRAILEGIVKRPLKGVAHIEEQKSNLASVQYQGFLVAGVERWREYREQLEPSGKRPILFIMLNKTAEADDVGDWLRRAYPSDFGGEQTLVIHTDQKGEVSKKDLDKARDLARRVDDPNEEVHAIVSVLMLREGWDVKNVTVIVGLRPYSAKANILPEQTIGRGLRLMFGPESGYNERVDIIGNRKFLEFIDDLEREEEITLESFEVGKDKLSIRTISPELERAAYDIGLPELSPALTRKTSLAEEIDALDVLAFEAPVLPIRPGDYASETFEYEGRDILTLEKLVEGRYTIPEPQTSGEIIGYYAKLIASDLKLPSQFAHLAPKVRQFFAKKAFGRPVDLEDKAILSAMTRYSAAYVVQTTFRNALKDRLIEPLEPELLSPERMLSTCPAFPYSRPVYPAKHSIFNVVPCDNDFEREFARWLDEAVDVTALAKLPSQFAFSIEYTDGAANLRYYYPDFVVRLESGEHWLIETKGAETVEVAHKDRAARLWCENATELTGTSWRYLKVPQKAFNQLQPVDFADLVVLAG